MLVARLCFVFPIELYQQPCVGAHAAHTNAFVGGLFFGGGVPVDLHAQSPDELIVYLLRPLACGGQAFLGGFEQSPTEVQPKEPEGELLDS